MSDKINFTGIEYGRHDIYKLSIPFGTDFENILIFMGDAY
jgi:hypothetical protein